MKQPQREVNQRHKRTNLTKSCWQINMFFSHQSFDIATVAHAFRGLRQKLIPRCDSSAVHDQGVDVLMSRGSEEMGARRK